MSLLRTLLVWIVIALVGALAAQLLLAADPGYVLVRHGGVDTTTTVSNAIAMLLGVLVVFWLLVTLILLPFRHWGRYREARAQGRFGEGLDALHQGDYVRAGKLLEEAAEANPNYEAAARVGAFHAALGRGDAAAARAQLERLKAGHPASHTIAAAELAQRPEEVLAALEAEAAQPLPPRGLAMRADALADSSRAAEAYGLLGALRRQNALPEAELQARELRWAADSLRESADTATLAGRWDALSKADRVRPGIVLAYADRAAALGWQDAALRNLETALDAQWDETVAARYAALDAGDPLQRHARMERWLDGHPDSPGMMLGLARLHLMQRDWPNARDYLQRAIDLGAGAEVWAQLGEGFAANGDERNARLSYANAVRASRNEPVVALEPVVIEPEDTITESRDAHGLPYVPGNAPPGHAR